MRRLSGVTLTSYASGGSLKSSTAEGVCPALNDWYTSFSALATRGRSTGRPFRKKNCLSAAARPAPRTGVDTNPETLQPAQSVASNTCSPDMAFAPSTVTILSRRMLPAPCVCMTVERGARPTACVTTRRARQMSAYAWSSVSSFPYSRFRLRCSSCQLCSERAQRAG